MEIKKIAVVTLASLSLMACTATDLKNYKTLGAAGGAAGGALAGSLITGTRTGTLVGAGLGAAAGFGWGYYLDKQEAELKAQLANTGAKVERRGDELSVILPGGVTFDTDSDRVSTNFNRPLINIANVLNSYPDSRVIVEGHTDSTGAYNHNMDLSRRRALAVRNFLVQAGQVEARRISYVGFGPDEPIADNSTSYGRQQNRRVEIKILQSNNQQQTRTY